MTNRLIGIAALTLLVTVVGLSASPPQAVSAGSVLSTDPVALPSFADLVAGPRSPTEANRAAPRAT